MVNLIKHNISIYLKLKKPKPERPQLRLYGTVTTHLNATLKIALKILGLIILLIFLYFLETIIFLLIFGEGGQASTVMNSGLTKLIMYVFPLIIVIGIATKVFKAN